MKRTVVVLLLSLLAVAGVAAWRWWPRTTPPERVSDLYRRYEPNPHLSVAFIEGFKVNDTLAVDVTTVTALDDEGWDTLRADYETFPLTDLGKANLEKGIESLMVWEEHEDDRKAVYVMSYLKKMVYEFYVDNEEQLDNIYLYFLKRFNQ